MNQTSTSKRSMLLHGSNYQAPLTLTRTIRSCPHCGDSLHLLKGAVRLSCNLCGWVEFNQSVPAYN